MIKRKQLTTSISLALMVASAANAAEFIVQTNGDSGGGVPTLVSPGVYEIDTLRSAVEQADNELQFNGSDVIRFDPDLYVNGESTITLSGVGDVYNYIGSTSNSALGINSEVTVLGPDDGSTLTLSGGDSIRHFQVNNGGNLSLDNLTLTAGFAPSNIAGTGGAIVVDGGGSLTLTDSIVTNNVAETGGAINFRINSASSTISRSIFYGNSTTGTFGSGTGGAIFKRGIEPLIVDESTFTGNTANYSGGGLFTSGYLVVMNSTIHGNYANRGGGGIDTNNIGVLMLVNSTVSGNTANNSGGGVSIGTEADYSLVINSTISDNVARVNAASFTQKNTPDGNSPPLNSSGGGLHASNAYSVELHNTLITGNHETQSMEPSDIAANARMESSHNLFSVAEVPVLTHGVNGNQLGTAINPIDAKIQPLADNGGLTLTHRVASTSPAINAGDNALVDLFSLDYDQRGVGFDRVSGTVDIGAIESDVIFADGLD